MTTVDTHALLASRLINQRIANPPPDTPAGVVRQMGAMQAQLYDMAKWAVGLRLPASTETEVEHAFQDGAILRTHLLRPTWHFIAPDDIRWLLRLTAPHVHAENKFQYKKCGLDDDTRRQSRHILEQALADGVPRTRDALRESLADAGILADGHRLSYIMMDAELEGLIVSGPRQGKQFTYRLLDAAVPPVAALPREEALHALAARYFCSRGPATVRDFAYWSGLPLRDARLGAASLGGQFAREIMDGREYIWPAPGQSPAHPPSYPLPTFPMPDYDEYGMAYKDRDALLASDAPEMTAASVYSHWLVIGGVIAGTWRYPSGKHGQATAHPARTLSAEEQARVDAAMDRYAAFWGR